VAVEAAPPPTVQSVPPSIQNELNAGHSKTGPGSHPPPPPNTHRGGYATPKVANTLAVLQQFGTQAPPFYAGTPSDKVACRVELTVDQDAAQTLEFVSPGHISFGPSCLDFNPLNRSDCCVFLLNIQQFRVLPTHCIYVFCVDLRTNSHYFPIQH
jgi:hypothetical protein